MQAQTPPTPEAELLMDGPFLFQQVFAGTVVPAEGSAFDVTAEDRENQPGSAEDRTLIRVIESRGPTGARHPQHEVESLEILFTNHRYSAQNDTR
jgi:hypothetical protein